MDSEWVIEIIERLSEFGKTERGITRLAFSGAERQAREYVKQLMREAGLDVRVDAFGNTIGRLEGTDKNSPVVVIGSHLDTVPQSGKYDGAVSVVAGLAALKQLKIKGDITNSVELIIFVAEEPSRFGYSTMGSKAMVGQANIGAWSKARDQEGIAFTAALAEQGFDWSQIKSVVRRKEEIKAFLELHIEQGSVLQRSGKNIGLVEIIAAPTRLRIVVEGTAAHSGATPMDERQDALVSAAMIILAIQEIALSENHRGTVGTVGVLKVYPNAINVVPGMVEMGVDIRGVNHESVIETIQEIKDAISTIADDQETPVAIEVLTSDKPVSMNSEIIRVCEDACRKLNISCRRMPSCTWHDAVNMVNKVPAGIIFIPCKDGISHNPDEYAAPEHIMNGIAVLTASLYELAR